MKKLRTPKPSPLEGEGGARSAPGEGEKLARSLRRRMTDAERKLWFALRDRRFDDFKFRRQVPIGAFIADFACHKAKLIVEVDGGQHAESSKDFYRDRWLHSRGYRVLRYWNHDVLKNFEGVLEHLAASLSETPHPAPALRRHPSPARGEGKKEIAR